MDLGPIRNCPPFVNHSPNFSRIANPLLTRLTYLVGATTQKNRRIMLLRRMQEATDVRAAHQLVAGALPERLAGAVQEEILEAIRKRLVAIPIPKRALGASDYAAALAVFALVVLVTFAVVVPFLFIQDVPIAMRISNVLALVALYAYGHLLGNYTGGKAWRCGLAIAVLGSDLSASSWRSADDEFRKVGEAAMNDSRSKTGSREGVTEVAIDAASWRSRFPTAIAAPVPRQHAP